MSQDLAAILTGQPVAKPAAAKAPAKTYDPVDAAIRTVYGEAPPNATREERQAIAAVIVNRATAKGFKPGEGYDQIVQEPNQFEPWNNPDARKRLDALTPDSPEYKAIAADVQDILAGKANPYPGLTNFYAPKAQAALGRDKPDFDDGTGQQIGAHLFFAKGEKGGAQLAALLGADTAAPEADAEFAKTFGDPAKWDENADPTGAGLVPFGKGVKGTLNKAQTATYETFIKGNFIKPEEPEGSVLNPLWMAPGASEKDVPPGVYYVDAAGKLTRAEGGDEKSSLTAGFGRGVGDVMLSLGQLAPGAEDSTIRNRLEADQMAYDADYKGDLKSGLGRFTGQVVGSVPMLAGGEAMLAPALARTGIGRFLLGTAGKGAGPAASAVERVGQLATRGGSLAASGAAEGAAASALVSSANDQPLAEQMKTGALLGGALKPVGAGLSSGLSRFIGGGDKLAGAAAPIDQVQLFDNANSLPVRVPLSTGQITRAPGQQMAENAMLRGGDGDLAAGVMQGFRGEQQGALRSNVQAISDLIAGKSAAPGEGAKAVSDRLNSMRDAAKKGIDKAYDAARARGEDAMLATAKDVREGMIEGLRKEYNLEGIPRVAKEVESFGENGAPTVREIFDMRTRLSNLTQAGDQVEAGAARRAVRALDAYVDTALKNDLMVGDPKAVKAWKEAIKKRAAFGRLFEGDDLIEGLTERVQRGGGATLKVDPEEAANYILNRSNLGWVGKKNLGRDLKRLEGVLGKDSDEWNGLRAEVFQRLARAGEGAPEAGQPQFSGQNFQKAWEKAKREDPQVLGVMFTAEERALIDKFSEVAQVVTTPVKGGDNPSNSALTAKKLLEPMGRFLSISGGAGGGAAVGGIPGAAVGAALGSLLKELREILAVGKARKATYGAKPVTNNPRLQNSLIPGPTLPAAGGVAGGSLTQPPPQQ